MRPRLELARLGPTKTVDRIDTAAAWLAVTTESPHQIVLAAAYPGQFLDADINRLRCLAPLARIINVAGSWCEGEPRSGTPNAAVFPCLLASVQGPHADRSLGFPTRTAIVLLGPRDRDRSRSHPARIDHSPDSSAPISSSFTAPNDAPAIASPTFAAPSTSQPSSSGLTIGLTKPPARTSGFLTVANSNRANSRIWPASSRASLPRPSTCWRISHATRTFDERVHAEQSACFPNHFASRIYSARFRERPTRPPAVSTQKFRPPKTCQPAAPVIIQKTSARQYVQSRVASRVHEPATREFFRRCSSFRTSARCDGPQPDIPVRPPSPGESLRPNYPTAGISFRDRQS